MNISLSQWPSGLSRGSAATRLLGFAGSNSAGDVDDSVLSVGCSQVDVSATGRSLVQGSPTDRGV